ncbi:MAG: hypothetical protein HY726_10705 [Candidatus Rokubacteria bacterium]|nr:hypothetical protein [Candidatus Rokubacteria bacterium]
MSTREDGDLYTGLALAQVPRILGLADRREGARTYGCFDRYYWQYRLMDFPNARFQEGVHLLALLYHHSLDGNPFAGQRMIAGLARGAVDFWAGIRNRDGSVSEVYPNERSLCATAFSFAAVTEALLRWGWPLPRNWERTARWLARAPDSPASNQNAAAAVALYNCYLLTGDTGLEAEAVAEVGRLVRAQHPQGYYPEYGGADVGYHSLTLSWLVRYQQKAKDHALLESLRKAVAFVEERVGPDGRHDSSANSRRTQFLYPYGLVAHGSGVVARHLVGLRQGQVLQPGWLDDRYVIPLSVDFLEAGLEMQRHG